MQGGVDTKRYINHIAPCRRQHQPHKKLQKCSLSYKQWSGTEQSDRTNVLTCVTKMTAKTGKSRDETSSAHSL